MHALANPWQDPSDADESAVSGSEGEGAGGDVVSARAESQS